MKFKINDIIYIKNEWSYNPCFKAFHIGTITKIFYNKQYSISGFDCINVSEREIHIFNESSFNICPKFKIGDSVNYNNSLSKILAITYLSGENMGYNPNFETKPTQFNEFKYIITNEDEEIDEFDLLRSNNDK